MTISDKLQQIAENMNEVSNTGYRHGYQEGYDVGHEAGYSSAEGVGYDNCIHQTQPFLDEILELQESYIGGSE